MIFGLIGYPLGHSFSKGYFSEKFKKENITGCIFENYPLASINELQDLLKQTPLLKGFSVTIPYKEKIIPFLNQISPEAQSAGSVNCVRISGNNLFGFNTDIVGFERSIRPLLTLENNQALVLGTGGASKSVQFVLNKLNIDFRVVSRNPSMLNHLSYSQLDATIMTQHNIIINCTPVGMFPNVNSCPEIPYSLVTISHILFDLIYNPDPSLFLQHGKSRGAVIKSGMEMLEIQAEESWKIWNQS